MKNTSVLMPVYDYTTISTYLCPIHVVTFSLISILATDYIQKRRGQALLFSFEYNLLPNLISKFNHHLHYMDRASKMHEVKKNSSLLACAIITRSWFNFLWIWMISNILMYPNLNWTSHLFHMKRAIIQNCLC